MRSLFVILSGASVLFTWSTHATTVVFSPVPAARMVVDSNLVTVSASSLVWVGSFSNESFTFNPALSIAANVAAITSAGVWHQFSLDSNNNLPNAEVTGAISISATGKVGGSVTDNNSGMSKADFFNNKPLYLWLFNAATPAGATEMGIFRATSATPPWTFPTNGGGLGDTVTYSTTDSGAPTIAAVGGAGSTTSGSSGTLRLVASVPEPSILSLTGFAGVGMLCLRKRRRNVLSAV